MHTVASFYTLFLDIFLVLFWASLMFVLYKGIEYNKTNPEYKKIAIWVGICATSWFGINYYLAFTDITAYIEIPIGPLMLLFSSVGSVVLFFTNKSFREFIDATPLYLLIIPTFARIGGLVFVGVANEGLMGKLFALPLGWGDVIIGSLVPLVAYACYKKLKYWKTYVLWWNWTGILIYVVAISVALIAMPPFQLLHPVPDFDLKKYFPISTTAMIDLPLTTILHIFILLKLRRTL